MEFVGFFFFILFFGLIGFLRFYVFLDLSPKMGSPKPNIGERVPAISVMRNGRNGNLENSIFGFVFGQSETGGNYVFSFLFG